MKFYGSTLAEGTNFKNFTVDVGTEFPETPNTGEIFCKSTQNDTALYVYLVDTWCKLAIETPTNDFEFVSETVVTNSIGEYELVLTNANIEVFSINELVLNPTGPTFNKIVSIEIDILTALKDGDSRNHFRNFLLHRPIAKFLHLDLHGLHRLAPLAQRFFY